MKPRWVWHLHHESLASQVGAGHFYKTLAERRQFVSKAKPPSERALRLRLMKYVKGKMPNDFRRIVSLHNKQCRNCPWNRETIFPHEHFKEKLR